MCLAIPGKIVSINDLVDPSLRTGRVAFGGIVKEVNLSMLPMVKKGDYVLVHVGVAISKVDEAEAQLTLQYLREMGELEDLGG
ncbi:MAG: HypC/HybG/HupF family hydrogenase formation chaperone [Bacteroidetes bacterium]|nr:MAG: HypC/HybG/HupF family hydrogenase formation chaperone [Bacteroidota bacterium]